ncbi:AraC family transcriptional regulator [Dysgonomonas sp. Marseille-P4361]|uniref:AraC family transcriptional regulator n=1 Tax=Dysgonomonas sp. Marseille-P4361 TaxID=2161820 RepID=UPI000D5589D2|nr:AraC family transcriptional regulator [Dysgonomonas sp. Marseille-P4361]
MNKLGSIKFTLRPEKENISFFFDHVHIVAENQLTLHQQDSWELSYVITGKGSRMIGDTVEDFDAGEIVLIPPNIPHCWTFDKSVHDEEGKIENITIIFSNKLLEGLRIVFPEYAETVNDILKNKNAISFSDKVLENFKNLMLSMTRQNQLDRISSLLQIFQTIASIDKETNIVGHPIVEDKQTRALQNIYLYVMNNYHRDITLKEISRFIGMERSSFCVFFKKETGTSFFSYLRNYRIDSSCEMLLNTSKSIAEICFASGFRDIPYYNRSFKKYKQITPTHFREQFSKAK